MDEKYKKFFEDALEKFKINSPADLKTDAEKKEFFDYVDSNYKAKNEHVNKVKKLKRLIEMVVKSEIKKYKK